MKNDITICSKTLQESCGKFQHTRNVIFDLFLKYSNYNFHPVKHWNELLSSLREHTVFFRQKDILQMESSPISQSYSKSFTYVGETTFI